MSHRVRVAPGVHNVTLPGGTSGRLYGAGDELVVSDDEYEAIPAAAFGPLLVDLGEDPVPGSAPALSALVIGASPMVLVPDPSVPAGGVIGGFTVYSSVGPDLSLDPDGVHVAVAASGLYRVKLSSDGTGTAGSKVFWGVVGASLAAGSAGTTRDVRVDGTFTLTESDVVWADAGAALRFTVGVWPGADPGGMAPSVSVLRLA